MYSSNGKAEFLGTIFMFRFFLFVCSLTAPVLIYFHYIEKKKDQRNIGREERKDKEV